MSTHQCTASFAFEALFNKANHVTLNLTVYWLSVDNFMYPTNHATRRITRVTRLRVTFRFRKRREMLLVSLFALLALLAFYL